MTAAYDIWFCDLRGYRLANVRDWLSADFALVANNACGWQIELPNDAYREFVGVDNVAEFWRDGRLIVAGFMRTFRVSTDDSGKKTRVVGGYDGSYLLTSRIVNYYAGSTYSDKSGYADDIMKAIVRENLGASSTDTSRDLSSYNFIVSGDISNGASISRAFSYDNVMSALQSIAESSRQAGTDLYFSVDPVPTDGGNIGWRFITKIGQLGQDRRIGYTDNAVVFSDQNGRISEPDYQIDYAAEATYAVGGGAGIGIDRDIQTATGTRIGRSPWSRREIFVDARMEQDSASVANKADAGLNASRPFASFRCVIADTPVSRYGIDWGFGDRITVEYDGQAFDAIIKQVRISITPQGEAIVGTVELEG